MKEKEIAIMIVNLTIVSKMMKLKLITIIISALIMNAMDLALTSEMEMMAAVAVLIIFRNIHIRISENN